jgi:hypothetical protein
VPDYEGSRTYENSAATRKRTRTRPHVGAKGKRIGRDLQGRVAMVAVGEESPAATRGDTRTATYGTQLVEKTIPTKKPKLQLSKELR